MNTKYASGQLIHHRRFGYRGVILCADESFQGSDEWYQRQARSKPPKDRPWYRVLVHGSAEETYVAERNLEPDITSQPVEHPLVPIFFDELKNGRYIRTRILN
jgi:heat shock protein HspQ